jgi:hypothetical protein
MTVLTLLFLQTKSAVDPKPQIELFSKASDLLLRHFYSLKQGIFKECGLVSSLKEMVSVAK